MADAIYKVRDPQGNIREIKGPEGASDDEVIARAKELFQTTAPSNTRVALNAASKGIASIPDALLNAPQNVANLGRAAVGTVATAAGRPDLAPELTSAPNYANRALRAVGAIGEGGEPATQGQRVLDATMQGVGGMMGNPVSSLRGVAQGIMLGGVGGTAGGVIKEATGSDEAAMAASLLTPAAANVVGNRARNAITEAGIRQSENAVRDRSLMDARARGYVVAPSEIDPSATNNILESVAGKAPLRQAATLRNQPITTQIAREELGLPRGTAITRDVLENYRNATAQPYREVAQMSPVAAQALESLNQVRAESRLQWNYYNTSRLPDAHATARALDNQAMQLEQTIERIAARNGTPQLLDDLRRARMQIAKSHEIERALNLGDASVSAPTLGAAYDRGAPLTNGLETIARFQQGPGRKFTGEGSITQAPGVSATNPATMVALGAVGGHTMGGAGVLAGGLPIARGPMRRLLLSPAYQRFMASPEYQTSLANRGLAQLPQSEAIAAFLMANPQAQNKIMELLR